MKTMNSEKGLLVVVSGFSGAGKGTLVNRLITDYDCYALSISMTTRKPRTGEVHGKSYFFVSEEEFENRVLQDGFVEHACYCGNHYGTPKDYVEEQLHKGLSVILEIEIQGALSVKKQYPDALLVFVTPPSAEELRRRLNNRGTETGEVIMKRLARACEEAEGMDSYDYVLVNDDLDDCVRELHQLINAARCAPKRCGDFIDNIRGQLKELVKGE